ncbi:MAG: AraC family transcriptional regulator [Eubacteriales bacterium]|nr:AraC family transcriptional regulator [Clostridiales bacterium]MDD7301022.1 AraC family transcriptional regulator [Eubacteriales bacterium]
MMNYEYDHKRYDNFGVISISIREYGGAYTDRQPCPFPRQLPGARALFSPHNHESTEVLYIREGTLRALINDSLLELRAGDSLIVNPYDTHSGWLLPGESVRYDCLMIGLAAFRPVPGSSLIAKLISDVTNGTRRFSPVLRGGSTAGDEFGRIFTGLREAHGAYLTSGTAGSEGRIFSGIYGLLSVLAEHIDEAAAPSDHDLVFIRDVTKYIDAHYAEELAADDVGNALGYGHRNFYRLFRQNFCCTFSAYLREYRINRAAQEFRDSEEPISHIARAVGFNDYSYFSRCFRQYTGVAPAAYFRNWTK